MRRTLTLLSTLMLAILLATSSVSAASPHFIKNATGASGPDASGNLTVSFKIAGLGKNVTLTIEATGDGTAVYACQNNGGNFPSDPKKQEVNGPVSASGEFTSGQNGQITGSLTLKPPASTLSCPPGQNEVLASVSYSDVTLSAPGAELETVFGDFSEVYYDV
jgi:hypothetical protein